MKVYGISNLDILFSTRDRPRGTGGNETVYSLICLTKGFNSTVFEPSCTKTLNVTPAAEKRHWH